MTNLAVRSDIERRNFIRLAESLPVKARLASDKILSFEAITRDISEGGVSLNTNIKKENLIRKDVILEISIPEKKFSLNIKAVIVWTNFANDNINALGMKFIDIPELARNYLKSYILEKISPHVSSQRPQEFFQKSELELTEKEKRNLLILDTLRRRSPISKVEISQEVGLNMGTVSNYVEEYIKKGIVFEKGLDVSTGGRRPNLLELNAEYSFSIGLDLSDKDYLRAILTDFKGQVINKIKEEKSDSQDDINQKVNDLINELMKTSKIDLGKINGIGLGVGSYTNNYHPIKNSLEKTFGLGVLVKNSCSASIFAERWCNPDLASIKNILYLSLKEDSFGLILGGLLYSGASGYVGKISLNEVRKTDTCEQKQCWLSENCILRKEVRWTQSNSKDLSNYFGIKLAMLVNLLNPELVIIAGTHPKDKDADIFLESIRSCVKRWSFDETAKGVKIIFSQLDDMNVCLGVSSLVTREIFTQI